jgi:hypothetical protein
MHYWLWLLALLLLGRASPSIAQSAAASWAHGRAGGLFAADAPVWRGGLILGSGLLLVPEVVSIWRRGGRFADPSRPGWRPGISADRALGGAGRPLWSFVPGTAGGWGLGESAAPAVAWNSMEWARPVDLTVTRLARVSNRFAVLGAGVRYWSDTPTERTRHWGLRLTVSFQF